MRIVPKGADNWPATGCSSTWLAESTEAITTATEMLTALQLAIFRMPCDVSGIKKFQNCGELSGCSFFHCSCTTLRLSPLVWRRPQGECAESFATAPFGDGQSLDYQLYLPVCREVSPVCGVACISIGSSPVGSEVNDSCTKGAQRACVESG